MGKWNKTARVLYLFESFLHGETVRKDIMAERFATSEKAIQRDIDELRSYCMELVAEGKETHCGDIVYSRAGRGYQMQRAERQWLTNSDILCCARILLESRAFVKEEMNELLTKLVAQSSPEQRHVIEDIIRNEAFHYSPVSHATPLMQRIWELGQAVNQQRLVELTYRKEYRKEVAKRVVEPRSVFFSEYYFYLIADIHDSKYPFPAIYRLDRILESAVLDETYRTAEKNRFEEGIFRKRVQFMRPGELIRIRFRYTGLSLEAILDRLPTASVIEENGNSTIIEAEVFGTGISMWLLSQGNQVEVLSPVKLRQEMHDILQKSLALYTAGAE